MSSKDYFNQVASQWDEMRTAFFSEAVRERAYAVAGVKPGQVAADIGAGTGFVAEGLVQRGLHVICVDQSEAMLVELRKKFASTENVEYRLGEAESLPIPDASLDAVFANMYLHHVEDPARAIGEMRRTLRPGGRLVITDMDAHGFEFLLREHHDRWMGFMREDVRRWFAEAGLLDVAVEGVGESCSSQSSSEAETASVSIFVASGTRAA